MATTYNLDGTIKTPAIFRKWRSDGEIIALFPELPAHASGFACESYQLIGQHGAANYEGVVGNTDPASEEEYGPLLEELYRVGYRPVVLLRASSAMHQRRRQAARELGPYGY